MKGRRRSRLPSPSARFGGKLEVEYTRVGRGPKENGSGACWCEDEKWSDRRLSWPGDHTKNGLGTVVDVRPAPSTFVIGNNT